jgi:hypothetical protein
MLQVTTIQNARENHMAVGYQTDMAVGYQTDFVDQRIEPFQVFGNLYYVGTRSRPAYLIKTTDGLILLDTGMP